MAKIKPLKDILAVVKPRNDREKVAAKEFYEALNGGLRRDTLDNSGKAFTGEVMEEAEKRFDSFVEDPHFQDIIIKG